MGGEITLTGQLRASAADLAALRTTLPEHLRLTRAEPGCLAFHVTPDPGDPTVYHVHERFRDRAAFDAHQARSRASAWWRATSHLPRRYQISEG